jgi:DNA replication protein
LAEHEIAERSRRRLERHLAEARLPPGKTLDSFDFEAVPVISKAQVMALAAGDAWLNNGANLLLFGPPGGGKSHLAAALGLALVENGWRVLFTRPPISSSGCKLPAASSLSKPLLPSSTNSIC